MPVARLEMVSPSTGPIDGGSDVSVLGSAFHERSSALFYLHCRFNSTSVPALFVSRREVRCSSPEMPDGHVEVAVTNNLLDYVGDVFFEYARVRVLRLHPHEGPVAGGTRVYIHGSNFPPGDTYCRFEALVVTATFISRSMLSCTTPRQLPGGMVIVNIYVSDAVILSAATFHYVQEPRMQRVHPLRGPLQGGTTLSIYGASFAASAELLCIIGSTAVPGRVRSERHLECTTPANTVVGKVALALHARVDGMVPTVASGHALAKHFEYHHAFRVLHLAPAEGPVHGGTMLHLSCDGVPEDSMLHCRLNSTVVEGTRLSSALALCRTPAVSHQGLQLGIIVTVELSANLQDFSADGNTFEYQVAIIHIVTPRRGPLAGGTMVTIVGTNMLPRAQFSTSRAGTSCVFLHPRVPSLVVPASRQTSSSLLCLTPKMHAPSDVSLAVRVFNATLGTGSRFGFLATAHVSLVWPTLGPIAGGTRIQARAHGLVCSVSSLTVHCAACQVLGSSFDGAAETFCRFQIAGGSIDDRISSIVVAAQWHSANRADCVAPPAGVAQHILIELGWNGQQFTTNQASFEFVLPAAVAHLEPAHVPATGGKFTFG